MSKRRTVFLLNIIGGIVAACTAGGCGPAVHPSPPTPQTHTPPPPSRPDPEPAVPTPGPSPLPDGVPQRRDLLIGAWETEDGQHSLVFSGDGGKNGSAKYRVRWDARVNPIPEFKDRRWLVTVEFPYQWESQQVVAMNSSHHTDPDANCPEEGNRLAWVSPDALRLVTLSGDHTTAYRRAEAGGEVTEADRRQEEQDRYRRLMAVISDPNRSRPSAPPTPPGVVTVTRGSDPEGAQLVGKVVAVDDAARCVDRKIMQLLPPELWAFNPNDLGTVIRVKRSTEDESYGEGLIFRQEKWELRLVYAPSGQEMAATTIAGKIPTGKVYYTKGSPNIVDVNVQDVKKYLSDLPRRPLDPK